MQVELMRIQGANAPLSSKTIKFIKLIGVELEGAWEEKPDNIHEDRSIRDIVTPDRKKPANDAHNCHLCIFHHFKMAKCITDPEYCIREEHTHCPDDCNNMQHCDTVCVTQCKCLKNKDGIHIGECISDPSSIEQLRSWVNNNAPDIVNYSCGLHVHLSFNTPMSYVRLMDKAFFEYFIKWFDKWGKDMNFPAKHDFWTRLRGEVKYCLREHRADAQVMRTEKGIDEPTRRTQLNYCYNIQLDNGSSRGTLECRLFPAFQHPGHIMAAIESLVRCVETYLDTTEYKAAEYKEFKIVRTPRGYLTK